MNNFVSVYEHSGGYELYFDNYVIDIDVYNKQIVNYMQTIKKKHRH